MSDTPASAIALDRERADSNSRPSRRAAIAAGVLPYCVFALAGFVAVLAWYRGQALVWGADHNLPLGLEDIGRYFQLIDPALGGPDVRKLPFVLPLGSILWIWNASGLPYDASSFQFGLVWLLLAGSGASTHFLIRSAFPSIARLAAVTGALFYMFNLYALTVIWSPLSNLTFHYAFFPLVLALAFRSFRQGSIAMAAATAVVWALTVTPAYTATPVALTDLAVVGGVGIFYLAKDRGQPVFAKRLRALLVGAVLWCGLNAFWFAPLLAYSDLTLARGLEAGDPLALFKINSAPFFEAIRLGGYWGLDGSFRGSPFFPWASSYETFPGNLGFVLPALVVLALFWALRSRTHGADRRTETHVRLFAGLGLIALLLTTGAEDPFGGTKERFVDQLGLEGAYRSPYQRFGVYLTLAYAPLLAAGTSVLLRLSQARIPRHWGALVAGALWASLTVLLAGVLAWPMWNGALYDKSGLFPSNRVVVPREYSDVARRIDAARGDFLVVALPSGPDPAVHLVWDGRRDGFRGIEPLHLLSGKPFVFADAGTPFLATLVGRVAEGGRLGAEALQLLNARFVVVHRDAAQDYLRGLGGWIGTDTRSVEAKLARTREVRLVHSGRNLAVYELTDWRPFRAFTAPIGASVLDQPGRRLRPLPLAEQGPGTYFVPREAVRPGEIVVLNRPFDANWSSNAGPPTKVAPGLVAFSLPRDGPLEIRHALAARQDWLFVLALFSLVVGSVIALIPVLQPHRGIALSPPWQRLIRSLRDRIRYGPPIALARPRRQALELTRAIGARKRLLTYLVPAAVGGLSALTWQRPGTVIAGGDLSPPIAPGPGYRQLWSHLSSGEGAPSYDIVAVPYYESLRFADWLGLDPGIAQGVWYVVVAAAAAAAATYFVAAFTDNALPATLGGILVVLSPAQLLFPAGHPQLAALALAGVLGGMIVRAGRLRKPSPLAFGLASVALGFVFVNPALVYVVLLWLLISIALAIAAGGRPGLRAVASFVAASAPIALLLNLWWVVPAALVIGSPAFEVRFAAPGVDSWEFTHANATLANVVTGTSAWNWPSTQYFPYAAILDRQPYTLLRVALPTLAMLGVVLARGRRERSVAYALAGGALIVVIAAKGLHPPASGLNRWLYDNAPGYWLLRDPTKLLLLLALIYGTLASFALVRLFHSERHSKVLAPVTAALLVGAAFAYAHPLWTGAVVSDERNTSGPTHVVVPTAWTTLAELVAGQPAAAGKVIVLPTTDFYQVPTRWGYRGPSFVRSLLDRGVYEAQSDAYVRSPPSVDAFVRTIERDLLAGRPELVRVKLRALGVGLVVLRRDLLSSPDGGPVASAERIEQGLQRVPGSSRIADLGTLALYRVQPNDALGAFAATAVPYLGPPEWMPDAIALDPGTALIQPSSSTRMRYRVLRSQRGRWELSGRSTDSGIQLRLTDPLRVELPDGGLSPRAARIINIAGVAAPALLDVGENATMLPAREGWVALGTTRLAPVTRARVWKAENPRALSLQGLPIGNCRAIDSSSPSELGLRALPIAGNGVRLQLPANAQSACVSIAIGEERPVSLSFDHRRVRGAVPRICVWEIGPNRCAPQGLLFAAPGWHRFSATVLPARGTTALRLYLYADATAAGETVSEYRNLAIADYRLGAGTTFTVDELREIASVRVTPNRTAPRHAATRRLPIEQARLQDCARSDPRTFAELGLERRVRLLDEPVVQLRARAHSACVRVEVDSFDPRTPYRVRLAYRTLAGSRARLCLWQLGPERCAQLPPLQPSRSWRTLDTRVLPTLDTTGLVLFLYADGVGTGTTVTEYTSVRVGPIETLAYLGTRSSDRLPQIDYVQDGASRLRVNVTNARGPFLLVLPEGFAEGWRLRRQGYAEPRHLVANGFANGWMIPWSGSYELTLTYEPEQIARKARWSGLLVPAAVLTLLLRGRSRRLRRLRGT